MPPYLLLPTESFPILGSILLFAMSMSSVFFLSLLFLDEMSPWSDQELQIGILERSLVDLGKRLVCFAAVSYFCPMDRLMEEAFKVNSLSASQRTGVVT